MHSWIHLGLVEQSSIQAKGYIGGRNIQGEESVEGKLLIVWGNNGIFVLKGAHVEAAWQKFTSD